MGVLTWNLFHGRDFPPERELLTWRSRLLRITELGERYAQVNRSLLDEFAGWIARAPWEVALLQEAPPRWQRALADRAAASAAIALTSRNELPRLRRLAAELNPDLLASAEGGANQTLVRSPARFDDVRRLTLAGRPERRRMLWTRIEIPGGRRLTAANLHATAGNVQVASAEVERAAAQAVEWAAGDPLVFGGDLNVRPFQNPGLYELLAERFGLERPTGPRTLDHLLVRGLELVEPPRKLPAEERDVDGPHGRRLRLSDHAPVLAAFGLR